MRRTLLGWMVCLACAFVVSNCDAASLACTGTGDAVERMICGEDELAAFESELARAIARAREGGDATSIDREQLSFLASRRACRSTGCVLAADQQRLDQLVSIRDDITCADMHAFPHATLEVEPDLGSGFGQLVRMDLACPGSLGSLTVLDRLASLTESTRNEDTGQCSGSIRHGLARHFSYELEVAGLAPRIFLRHSRQGNARWHTVDPDAASAAYFAQWADDNRQNYLAYVAYNEELARARGRLVVLERQSAHMSPSDAKDMARAVTRLFESRAFGAFPARVLRPVGDLVVLLRDPRTTPGQLRAYLANHPKTIVRDRDAYDALRVAMIRRRDPAFARELIESIGTIDDAVLAPEGGSMDQTPLFEALWSPELTVALLAHGADVDRQNSFGKTPLFYAVGDSQHAMVALLVAHGADVNHRYKSAEELGTCPVIAHSRRTPLMHAAQHSDPSMIALLVAFGARLADADDPGATALDYALTAKRPLNVAALEQATHR